MFSSLVSEAILEFGRRVCKDGSRPSRVALGGYINQGVSGVQRETVVAVGIVLRVVGVVVNGEVDVGAVGIVVGILERGCMCISVVEYVVCVCVCDAHVNTPACTCNLELLCV